MPARGKFGFGIEMHLQLPSDRASIKMSLPAPRPQINFKYATGQLIF